jgi:hypothetical protein
MNTIPIEILMVIIGPLFANNRRQSINLALVCKQWAAIGAPYLTKMEIDMDDLAYICQIDRIGAIKGLIRRLKVTNSDHLIDLCANGFNHISSVTLDYVSVIDFSVYFILDTLVEFIGLNAKLAIKELYIELDWPSDAYKIIKVLSGLNGLEYVEIGTDVAIHCLNAPFGQYLEHMEKK